MVRARNGKPFVIILPPPATTKTTKTVVLQESCMDLVGQIKGAVKNDSSFTVSVTRKMTSLPGKMVIFQERGMQPLVLDILNLR